MSVSQRTCSHHEGAPAIAVCIRCRGDICAECHRVDLRGMAICQPCARQLSPPNIPFESQSLGPTPGGFAQTVIAVLSAPRSFFGRYSQPKHWGLAATFGMTCIAIGTLLNTLWQKAFADDYTDRLQHIHDEFGVASHIAEFTLFATIPLTAVILYFLHTALLYVALRAFAVKEASWPLLARITGYSLAAYLLLIFPPIGQFSLGHFLMILWLFNLEVSAVRHFFGLGFWKSMGVVLLPFMVFIFAVG